MILPNAMTVTMQNHRLPAAVAATTPLSASSKHTVAFTTPPNYAARLSHLLTLKGYIPLWCPTVLVHPTPHILLPYLSPPFLQPFSALAFTSRTAIHSFSEAAAAARLNHPLLSSQVDTFLIAALGKDAELIDSDVLAKFCHEPNRIRVLVPPTATPRGLVESLGEGNGRKILCLVPLVVGLEEPSVVPDFLRDLEANGWAPVRVNAYETRWAGPECAREVVERCESGALSALVFTSTAEVEGMLKSLREFGWTNLGELVRERCPEMVVAAHGPVTAAGAERLGVKVDVVSSRFDSFDGVVDALGLR